MGSKVITLLLSIALAGTITWHVTSSGNEQLAARPQLRQANAFGQEIVPKQDIEEERLIAEEDIEEEKEKEEPIPVPDKKKRPVSNKSKNNNNDNENDTDKNIEKHIDTGLETEREQSDKKLKRKQESLELREENEAKEAAEQKLQQDKDQDKDTSDTSSSSSSSKASDGSKKDKKKAKDELVPELEDEEAREVEIDEYMEEPEELQQDEDAHEDVSGDKFPDNALVFADGGESRCVQERKKGGRVVLTRCSGRDLQSWAWQRENFIRSPRGTCLSIKNSNKNGRMVVGVPCDLKSKLQKWQYIPVGKFSKFGLLRNMQTNQCMIAPSHNRKDNTMTVGSCEQHCGQLFVVTIPLKRWTKNTFATNASLPVMKHSVPRLDFPLGKFKKSKILCWIMTDPRKFSTRATAVRDTWGNQCDKLLFMSNITFPGFDTVQISLRGKPESREMLWQKAKGSWQYVFDTYGDEYDWFLRGDDDTYVNMDNLREYLTSFNPDKDYYMGRLFFMGGRDNRKFYSGGAGNIYSRSALKTLFNAVAEDNTIFANWDSFADDAELSFSSAKAGIDVTDYLDEEGRNLFLALGVGYERIIDKSVDPTMWFFVYSRNFQEGKDCCSKRWIITHYSSPYEQYVYHDLHQMGCEAAGYDPY